MGDKGKKDKDKGRKQKINKQEQKAKSKLQKQPRRTPWQKAWWGVCLTRTVNVVVSLDRPAMADSTASVGFSGRQGSRHVKTTIRDEVRGMITELQNDREPNHAVQATPNGAPDGWRYALFQSEIITSETI